MADNRWDSSLYDSKHGFVAHYGEDLIGLLAPQAGERILDLGCGTGHLTQQIASTGAVVTGMDRSPSMIEGAQGHYPDLTFVVGNGEHFAFDTPFDAVFSNAALHWMTNADAVVSGIADALKPGGRFVAELGGKTNIQGIYAALLAAIAAAGQQPPTASPWFFPSVGEYATLLEGHGLFVDYAVLFPRPTPLDGDDGLRNWLHMFADHMLRDLPEATHEAIINDVERRLRPTMFSQGQWRADYVRLRITATRQENI